MSYEEILSKVYEGKVVKSNECFYIKPNKESCTFWKWIGEDSWTLGEVKFEDCVNEYEKNGYWEVIC